MTDEAERKLVELDEHAQDLHQRVSSMPPAAITVHEVASTLREVAELTAGLISLVRMLKGL